MSNACVTHIGSPFLSEFRSKQPCITVGAILVIARTSSKPCFSPRTMNDDSRTTEFMDLFKPEPDTWAPLDPPPDITGTGFYVGTSGYYFEDWLGRFNPPKVTGKRLAGLSDEARADQDQLRFYQKYFPLVEINNTFYREPMLTNFVDIERRSRPATKYVVKVYRDISHTKRWEAETGKALMRNHITAVSPLVETGRFYSFLIQLEDRTIRNQERLDYFLAVASEAVRMKLDVHIEFRHNSWHNLYPLQALKDSGIGICNTEIPPVKYAFPLKAYATTEKGYVRYSGRNIQNWVPKGKQKTSKARIEARNARYDYLYSEPEMEERVEGQIELSQKASSVAVVYNNHYQIQAVLNAIQNMRRLNQGFRKIAGPGTGVRVP